MELLLHSIAIDWPVLLPIFVCSILVVAVAINRFSYYNRNKRNIGAFIQDLASQGNQSTAVAMGIASALIATAFGLGVAIVAVVLYNYFQTVVTQFESDFKLIKLVFLSFIDSDEEVRVEGETGNVAL